jgi:hypothetical protein
MMFLCIRAKEIWDLLGFSNEIQQMVQADRSGSVVVAEIIKGSKRVENLNHIGLAELILTDGWYMWWERRKLTHGETVQKPARSAVAIATLASNYQSAAKKTTKARVGWSKPRRTI